MNNDIDNLRRFLDKIKTIGFWERLFSWGVVKQQLVDAAADLQKLITNLENLKEQSVNLTSENSGLTKDIQVAVSSMTKKENEVEKLHSIIQENSTKLTQFTKEISSNAEMIKSLSARKNELDVELAGIKEKLRNAQEEFKVVKQQNTQLLAEEKNRIEKSQNDMSALASIREQIQNDRNKEVEERNNIEINRIKNLKDTWSKHQENVKNIIKSISSKHTIEYVDKVPFRGEPDNVLKICEEFVIFDSKSPGTDDLSNFPNYLKDQSERAKKYAKQENVKSDIFFVVPSNTLEKLEKFVFNLGDYNVFIISVDSLEQIILSLKKIEEYQFIDQLSPDERDDICRILGKFAHITKRRIQIDSYFAKQFIELAYKAESDLPKEILDKVVEYEKSEKLNPPTDKRAKVLSIKELEKDTIKIKKETSSRGIAVDDDKISAGINKLELYKTNTE